MRNMKKVSHFHDIRPVIDGVDGKTTCEAQTGTSCTLDLRWVLQGDYPDAAVYRKMLPGGSLVRLFTSIPNSEEGRSYTLSGVGNYEFQIRRTGSSSSDLIARSVPVQVRSANSETPPSPVADPNFGADTASARTGATRGEFRVSESGAASYRIQFMAAPSGGGVAPELALSYNSQAGAGAAGLGWNLEGLSSITRCASTLETDGIIGGVDLSQTDRFCMDGQRLIAINGAYGANATEYRLEVDQIVRIQSFGSQGGGPAWFKVWRKDGTISWYGATEGNGSDNGGARVSSKRNGTQSPVWVWHIGRMEDSAGNRLPKCKVRALWT